MYNIRFYFFFFFLPLHPHLTFTLMKEKVKIKYGVLWICRIWGSNAYRAISSRWVSCLPIKGSLLNINTNQHSILITVYSCVASYLGICSQLHVPVPGLLKGHFSISESEGKKILSIIVTICHTLDVWSVDILSLSQYKQRKSLVLLFDLPTGEIQRGQTDSQHLSHS